MTVGELRILLQDAKQDTIVYLAGDATEKEFTFLDIDEEESGECEFVEGDTGFVLCPVITNVVTEGQVFK